MYERDYVTYLTVQAVSVVYGFAYRNLTETLLVSKYILTSRAGRLRVGLFSADTSTIKKEFIFLSLSNVALAYGIAYTVCT